MRDPHVVLVAAALAFGALAVHLLVAALGRALRRWRMRARARRASDGEARAATLLEAHGFEVVAAQVAVEYAVRVDDREVSVRVRADYVVEKDSARFVAEVKTGEHAPRIETPATRRQLLEYRIAFDVDGVLLVDVEAGRVHGVVFPGLPSARPRRSRGGVAWIIALAVVCAVVLVAQR